MDDFFKYRHNILNHSNFTVCDEYERVVKNCFHFIRICCHIRRNITAVKLHTFNSLQTGFHSFGFFNSNNTVVADLFHSVSNQTADFFISCGNRCNLSFSFFSLNLFRNSLQFFYQNVNSFLNTFFQHHWISAGSNIAHALTNHSLCQNSSSGSTVTGNIVSFCSNFFYKLRTHIFKRIFKFNITGNSYAIVSNSWRAKFLFEHYITSFRTKGYLYCIC